MFHAVKRLYRPEYFQGHGKRRRYFEGWYFKFVFPDRSFAVIPGISLNEEDSHAFIQRIDGDSSQAPYLRFPREQFAARKDRFQVTLGDSVFSLRDIQIQLPGFELHAEMGAGTRWPSSLLSPGTMGWYSFVPGMECRHGIIIMDAPVRGSLNGRDLGGGRFYLEKDYGRSFPKGWIWLQSNSFSDTAGSDPASVSVSIARVPFYGRDFTGFLVGVLAKGTVYRFTSYTGAQLEELAVSEDRVKLLLRQERTILKLMAVRTDGVDLRSPVDGVMEGRVNETLSATVQVELSRDGDTVFRGTGTNAGLEVVNPDILVH